MKTKEELNALKEEFEALKGKLAGLTEEELKQVASGIGDKDGARVDHRVHCTKCGGSWWSMDVPDRNTCPACGAHGTLVDDK